jgi:Na+-driven multidrug efflux pump
VEYSFVFASLAMMARSVFQAMGRPWPGLIITALRMVGLVVPFALFFVYVLEWGIYGVWGGMIAGNILGAIISLGWVRVYWNRLESGKIDYAHTKV